MFRRSHRRALIALACVELVFASGLVGYRWMTSSTEVTLDEAVERFGSEGSNDPTPTPVVTETPTPGPTPTPTPSRSSARVTGPTPAPAPTPVPERDPAFVIEAPQEGVFAWRTEGHEEAGPLSRDMPPVSYRKITRSDDKTWTNHHIYSDEHEEWFELRVSEQGVSSTYSRSRVRFGSFGQDMRIDFQPPARFSAFPMEIGQRWTGEWEGDTSGTYEGETLDHTTVRVGDEGVEAWKVDVVLHMEGEVNGTMHVILWVSPKYRTTVKEDYTVEVSSSTSPGTYRGDYTITLCSTTPGEDCPQG